MSMFFDLHSELLLPLKTASVLDDISFPADEALLDAYRRMTWDVHIDPNLQELFGEDYANQIERSSFEAKKLLAFLDLLGNAMQEEDGDEE